MELAQIDDALHQWEHLKARSKFEDCSDQPGNEITEVIHVLASTIERVARSRSHRTSLERAMQSYGPSNPYLLTILPGILKAIRSDYDAASTERAAPATDLDYPAKRQPDRKSVFVVHGRNEAARRAIFSFLRAIDLKPIEWNEATSLVEAGSPYIGEVLDAAFSKAQAVLVLLTGDDVVRLGTRFQKPADPAYELRLFPQVRPNVLFEAGMAFGRRPERTVLVVVGEVRPFSDIAGRHLIRMENGAVQRQTLIDRLRATGCDVETAGRTDWLHEGDFDSCMIDDPDDAKSEWMFNHPADYSGPIWIRITAKDEQRSEPHKFALRWGSWEYSGVLDLRQGNIVSLMHTKGDDHLSVPIRFQISPPSRVEFGQGSAPGGTTVDINEGWTRRE